MTFVQTDARSRVVLTGHPNEYFLVQENADGSIPDRRRGRLVAAGTRRPAEAVETEVGPPPGGRR